LSIVNYQLSIHELARVCPVGAAPPRIFKLQSYEKLLTYKFFYLFFVEKVLKNLVFADRMAFFCVILR